MPPFSRPTTLTVVGRMILAFTPAQGVVAPESRSSSVVVWPGKAEAVPRESAGVASSRPTVQPKAATLTDKSAEILIDILLST